MLHILFVFFDNFFRRETLTRAIGVAFVVAPILIVINQYEAIISLKFNTDFLIKSLLMFIVPFCVSAYSSAQAYSKREF
ncbi:MAG: nitrate/nitrite transporter NrtS [Candidatus Dadabacteria bacterium]|nr:nitrate/nitrite transporter NrtS [Candidatus Dadabacteria bacterium]